MENGVGDHNYCRNANDGLGAWCYTAESDLGWDYCDCHTTLPEDEELDFFDMVRYRNWDVHPESLNQKLDTQTMNYFFRYFYGLGGETAFRNNKGFWEYTDWSPALRATFCNVKIKSATLHIEPVTTTTITTTQMTTTMTGLLLFQFLLILHRDGHYVDTRYFAAVTL